MLNRFAFSDGGSAASGAAEWIANGSADAVEYEEVPMAINRSELDRMIELMRNRTSRGGLPAEHIVVVTLCAVAVLANVAALAAIRGIRRALAPNQMLIASLCCADLLTSVSILCYRLSARRLRGGYDDGVGGGGDGQRDHGSEVVAAAAMDEAEAAAAEAAAARQCAWKLLQALVMASHNATLLSLLGLSVDHYCAVALPLRQPVLWSLSRVRATVAGVWVLAFALGFSDFYMPAPLHGYCQAEAFANYCETVACSTYEPDHLLFVVVAVCLVVMSVLYALIAAKICAYHRRQWPASTSGPLSVAAATVPPPPPSSSSSSATTKRNGPTRSSTRGLVTTVIILVTFCVLWLPFCVFDVFITLKVMSLKDGGDEWATAARHYMGLFQHVGTYLDGLIALNAIVDPVIYAVRMREVQQSLRLLCGSAPCARLYWRYRGLYPSGFGGGGGGSRRSGGTGGGANGAAGVDGLGAGRSNARHGLVKVWAGVVHSGTAGYPSHKKRPSPAAVTVTASAAAVAAAVAADV